MYVYILHDFDVDCMLSMQQECVVRLLLEAVERNLDCSLISLATRKQTPSRYTRCLALLRVGSFLYV